MLRESDTFQKQLRSHTALNYPRQFNCQLPQIVVNYIKNAIASHDYIYRLLYAPVLYQKKKEKTQIYAIIIELKLENYHIYINFQHKSLLIHSTFFNANPRPDALMKEQLVEMTGLSPRVIRVWFQNKRCKHNKKTNQMKIQMEQEKVTFDVNRQLVVTMRERGSKNS